MIEWRRPVVFVHRWLGILGCLLFIAWFASGIVMMYARMPELSPEERVARLPILDLSAARMTPDEASHVLGSTPQRAVVGMAGARPVYRFVSGGRWTTVFADDGRELTALTAEDAIREARRFAPEHAATVRYDERLTDADQWTLGIRALMPLHRIALGDAGDSSVYVSDRTGDVVMKTTARDRRWAYAGAVIHWIYFTPLRRHTAAWAQWIIWLAVAGTVMCALGLVWGVYAWAQSIGSPYRGWMQWHHYAGLLFGVTSMTWVFSGLLSMDPWDWHPSTSPTRSQREAFTGGPLRLDAVSLDDLRSRAGAAKHDEGARGAGRPKELEIVQFRGEPRVIADGHETGEIERARLVESVRAAMPGTPLEDITSLDAYDAYYYDRDGGLPLPVLRARFGDPVRTWLYVDPRRGAIVRKEERLSRVNRWLYHGLHSLDFPGFYDTRPLWDVVVIALSVGGLVSGVTAVAPAWRRLRRHARRLYGLKS